LQGVAASTPTLVTSDGKTSSLPIRSLNIIAPSRGIGGTDVWPIAFGIRLFDNLQIIGGMTGDHGKLYWICDFVLHRVSDVSFWLVVQ
jgi:hypothetical protein